MLEAAGYTSQNAAHTFFSYSAKQCENKTALDVYQLAFKTIKRIIGKATTWDECHLAFTIPLIRRLLPQEGQLFLDTKDPKSSEELLEAMQSWWTMRATTKPEVPKDRAPRSLTCYNCGKQGHKAADCRSVKQGNPIQTTSAKPAASVTPLHASPAASLATNRLNARPRQHLIQDRSQDQIKKQKPDVRRVSPSEVLGSVGVKESVFVLDTGAFTPLFRTS